QRQGQNNAAKKNAESDLHNARSNSQVVESHSYGKHDHDPFHANAQEARVLQVQVDGTDQHASGQKPGDNVPDQQDHQSGHNLGNVGEYILHKQRGPLEIKGGNPYQKSAHDD